MSRTHRARLLLPVVPLACALLALLVGAVGAQSAPPVRLLPVSGVIDQVLANHLADGIAKAEQDGAAAVVVQLDTPGGSLDATRTVVNALLDARIPVIVWVGPAGAHAASAGTFITLAANLSGMAPGTNIGAATPVGSRGEDIGGTLGQKVLNDTVAWMTSIADARGRPVDWAVSTVTDARAYTVDEAIAAGAVDVKAATVAELLAQVDGRSVQTAAGPVTLAVAGAPIEEEQMSVLQAFLHVLSDPNIAFILVTIGFLGLLVELVHPNLVTGILGVLALILAFVGFGSLPLNVAGLLLLGLAMVLFVLELTVTSHGLLAVGGLIAFVLGASALYTGAGGPTSPAVSVGVPVIAIMTALTAAFLALVVWAAVRVRRMPHMNIGVADRDLPMLPAGTRADVRMPLSPQGTIYGGGEEWSARSADGRVIERGVAVRVVGQDGLTLIVEPWPAAPSGASRLGQVG